MTAPARPGFARSRSTWLAYLMLGCFAYLEAALGPLTLFLRAEFGLSYTLASLHFSAFALGSVLVGLGGERVVRRWGRRAAFWSGAAGLAAGAALLAASRHPAGTIGGALVMGTLGALTLVTLQASLADEHGARRAVALAEANVVASACAILASVAVGAAARTALGWRAAPLLAVAAIGPLALAFRAAPLGPGGATAGAGREPAAQLPAAFWLYWLVLVLGVSVEWSMVTWGPAYLERGAGLSRAAAATAMGLFFAAMLAGRLLGSRLARRAGAAPLLLAALGVTLGAFPCFWLAPPAAAKLAGLGLVGLGVANLWPLAIAAATGAAAHQPDTANARLALGGGGAGLLAPFALGWLADRVGIQLAFGIAVPLLLGAIGAAALANRRAAPA